MRDPLRVYRYPAELCGGDGGVRLAGPRVVAVDRPEDADVFVVPQTLAFLDPSRDPAACARRFLALPHLAGRERRHVVVDIIEHTQPPPVPGVHYFRCGSAGQAICRDYLGLISWPWPTEDLLEQLDPLKASPLPWHPQAEFRADVGYTGYDTGLDLTRRAIASCQRNLRVEHVWRDHAWGWQRNHASTDPVYVAETKRHRDEYVEQVLGSRLTLEPIAADGVWRYRFWEAWALQRIPVHVGDHCLAPRGERVPYHDLAIFVPAADVDGTGEICAAWLRGKSDDDLRWIGRYARACWKTFLDPARWDDLMADVVAERLAAG